MHTCRVRTLLCGALSLAAACGGSAEPILIGLAGPFSQPRGRSMQLAAELAVNEINAQGGVRGRRLELAIRDDSAATNHAVRVAEELYRTPGVVAVIGHLTSGTTLAAAPVYNRGARPVPVISPSASNPQVSAAGPYTFRVCPDDLVHGRRLAEWARERLGATSAAVIYQNDDYGRGIRRTFAEGFGALGGVVATEDPYIPALPTFEPYLRRLSAQGGADVVLLAGARDGAERVLMTLDTVRLSATVMGGDGLVGIEALGPRAEGVYISTAYLADRPGAANEAFVAAYRTAYGDEIPDHRGAGAYDIVHLLARAIEAVGPDRAAIREYLAGVGTRTPAFEGVTGTIAFDQNGDVPDKDVVIGVVRDGRLVTAR